MYEEIIQSLMLSRMVGMILSFAFAIVGFFVSYFLFTRLNKKKKQSKNQREKLNKKQRRAAEKEKKEKEESFVAALVIALLICFWGCWNLYEYLSLRKDMVTENYATYTGKFCYEESYHKGNLSRYIRWEDENGKVQTINYEHIIDDYQPNNMPLQEGYYIGTIVYSPRGDYLLWWDAVPTGK